MAGPSHYYGTSKEFDSNTEYHKLPFPLYSKTNKVIILSEAQEVAIAKSVGKIINSKEVEVKNFFDGNFTRVLVPYSKYNEEHSDIIKETIRQTLSLT